MFFLWEGPGQKPDDAVLACYMCLHHVNYMHATRVSEYAVKEGDDNMKQMGLNNLVVKLSSN